MDTQRAVRSGPDAPQLLSTADVSKALGVAEITVRRLVRSGELVRIKVGRRTLVHPADVIAFVDARRAKSSKKDDGPQGSGPVVEEVGDEHTSRVQPPK
ncbi:MAG: helix-turn-helix domain-containing protein [Gaiellaceae bacterium]